MRRSCSSMTQPIGIALPTNVVLAVTRPTPFCAVARRRLPTRRGARERHENPGAALHRGRRENRRRDRRRLVPAQGLMPLYLPSPECDLAAARKAGPSAHRDLGELENLQVSMKGPADFVTPPTSAPKDLSTTVEGPARLRLPRRGRRHDRRQGQDPPFQSSTESTARRTSCTAFRISRFPSRSSAKAKSFRPVYIPPPTRCSSPEGPRRFSQQQAHPRRHTQDAHADADRHGLSVPRHAEDRFPRMLAELATMSPRPRAFAAWGGHRSTSPMSRQAVSMRSGNTA